MSQFDYTDFQILKALRKDARKPFSKIAEELNISNSLVHQRFKKLNAEGVISQAEFVIDEKKLGFKTKSYTGIRLREAIFAESVMKGLEKIPEVVECNYVSGNYAIFVLLYARDNEHLKELLYEQIHHLDGVSGTDTFICFETSFKRSLPLSFNAKDE